jgi:cell division protein FtsZ
VQEEAGYGTDLIWGNCYDEELGEKISVTVIATGFEHNKQKKANKVADDKVIVALDEDQPKPVEDQPKKKGLADIGYEPSGNGRHTVEFDDVRETIAKYQSRGRYSYDEPYVNAEGGEASDEDRDKFLERERKRRERLRNNRVKLSNPQAIIELENEPAYLRRGVNLDNVPDSKETSHSTWSINDDDELEVRGGNSFLHDNVD